jgi:hypothetical protein
MKDIDNRKWISRCIYEDEQVLWHFSETTSSKLFRMFLIIVFCISIGLIVSSLTK